MTNEIHINQWKQFFDTESSEKLGWLTKVEVLNADNGAQILSENLPLDGLIFENKNGQPQIEILVGNNAEHHQTHNILAPIKVYFRRKDENSDGTIEIEEKNGTKTLIYLTKAVNVSVKDAETKTANTSN